MPDTAPAPGLHPIFSLPSPERCRRIRADRRSSICLHELGHFDKEYVQVGKEIHVCAAACANDAAAIVKEAWFKKCHFQVTPEIDRALMVKEFLVLGVTPI